MNREIKFRGKVYHNPQKVYLGSGCQDGEWVYGDLHLQSANPYIHIKEHHREPIDVETIGQFTGLYDRNGTPIYEGDILRYPAKGTFEEKNFVSFEVFWHGNDCAANHVGWQMNRHHFHGSVCGTSDISTFLPKYTEKMVIIGNIHDNPELMK